MNSEDSANFYENDLSENDIKEITIIASIIKKRKQLGWSQKELSEYSSVSQSTISRLEAFGPSPSLDVILKLFDALGMDLSVKTKR